MDWATFKASTDTERNYSAGCLTLFALPFALCGLAVLYLAGSAVWSWQQMRSWEPVPAEILSVELESHDGDDSTTYRVAARYRYSFGGRSYVGERVAISRFADNIGDFHHDLHARLRDAQVRGEPVTAYVNPRHPDQAVLNRELRWMLALLMTAFGLVFAGVGLGLMFGAFISSRSERQQDDLKRRYPGQPWCWRPEWQDGRISGSNRATAYLATGFAVFWNLVSWPALSALPRELESGNKAALLALLFPLVGIGLAIWAIHAWLRLRRFGVSTLVLDSFPAPLGGLLRGTAKASAQIPGSEAFTVTLNCIEQRTRGSGDDSSKRERVLWQDTQTIPRHRCQISPGYSTIPIEIRVPADEPPTSEESADDEIIWRLEVSGECPGPDYTSRFDVPVFDTGQAAAEESSHTEWSAHEQAAEPDIDSLRKLGILVNRLPDGDQQWIFARARHKGVATGVTLFTLIWTGVTAGLLYSDAPLLFPIAFGLFNLIMIAWTLTMWFKQYRFRVGVTGLTLAKGLLGGQVAIAPDQVKKIKPSRGMQAGNKLYYDLKIETTDNREYIAARSLDDLSLARQIAGYLRASLAAAS
jgi:hypothetical protein